MATGKLRRSSSSGRSSKSGGVYDWPKPGWGPGTLTVSQPPSVTRRPRIAAAAALATVMAAATAAGGNPLAMSVGEGSRAMTAVAIGANVFSQAARGRDNGRSLEAGASGEIVSSGCDAKVQAALIQTANIVDPASKQRNTRKQTTADCGTDAGGGPDAGGESALPTEGAKPHHCQRDNATKNQEICRNGPEVDSPTHLNEENSVGRRAVADEASSVGLDFLFNLDDGTLEPPSPPGWSQGGAGEGGDDGSRGRKSRRKREKRTMTSLYIR